VGELVWLTTNNWEVIIRPADSEEKRDMIWGNLKDAV